MFFPLSFQRKHSSHLERYNALTAPQKRKAENPVPSTSRQLKLGETKIVNQTKVDNVVINFVIQSLQPFTVLEQPAFNALVQELQPNSRVMSRTTLRWKVEEGAQEMKRNIKHAMSSIEFIATTTDCWSARRRGFLGVTAHWVDPDSLKRCSVALACRRIKGPHTFDVLGSALNDIHCEFGIEKKIVTHRQWVQFHKGI